MVNFSFKIEPKSFYDFLCGRVKVLETNLISESLFKELVRKDFKGFIEVLQNYPYKNFLTSDDFESVRNAIDKRKETEFEEFSKFGLESFINVFFKTQEYFLLLKKISLGNVIENDFTHLLFESPQSLPTEFTECFEELKRDYPSYLKPLVVDVYYLNFLLRNAEQTKSEFLLNFYKSYTKNVILSTLMRNYNFVKNNFISEMNFNKILAYIKERLKYPEIVSKFKDFLEFELFLNESKGLYSEEYLVESYETLVLDTLRETFSKGKYLNEGIEPIFVYLLKLSNEASLLQKLAYALYYGVDPKEIPELEFAYE
ncbi:V-type ATPase subunit [Caldisericum exile]|uniref:V-type ATP synthase subunit C n=1 Tax=Caldisericum exile (strain DSM 21853 / NBRC 104410 / AZM16c01) TaxID=511051 RepID=A0A7U6GF84_CALEA|nr:V-type ATPase subunit [Caldisericum exile]BAL81286.1 hypothetical protein CSE_11600 [Caldisericum exile AZM16c01]